MDCIWLNPKYNKMGNLAAKPQIEEGSTTIESVPIKEILWEVNE